MVKSAVRQGWKALRLDELGSVARGRSRHRPRNDPALYGGPYPFVQTADVSGCDVYITSYSQTYSEAGLEQSRMWEPGTLCIVNAGENTGETGVLTFQACFPDSIIAFVPDREKCDVAFVNYSLRLMKASLRTVTKGATQDNLSMDKLLSFPLSVPPVELQRRIGGVLTAYDDLIENNTKRIKILEEMARSLYREWFVNFRFPGHQSARLVNSPQGKIPDGWRWSQLGENVLNFDSKRKPLSSMQRAVMKGEYPYYGAAKIIDWVNDYIFDGRYLLVAEDGSVVTTDRRPVLQIASGRFWVNNHTHILQGRDPVSTDLVFLRLSDLDVSPYITGAAQPKITQANLNRIPMLLPPDRLLQAFDRLVGPLMATMEAHREQNQVLRKARDLLLSRLISGELDVSSLSLEPAAS